MPVICHRISLPFICHRTYWAFPPSKVQYVMQKLAAGRGQSAQSSMEEENCACSRSGWCSNNRWNLVIHHHSSDRIRIERCPIQCLICPHPLSLPPHTRTQTLPKTIPLPGAIRALAKLGGLELKPLNTMIRKH